MIDDERLRALQPDTPVSYEDAKLLMERLRAARGLLGAAMALLDALRAGAAAGDRAAIEDLLDTAERFMPGTLAAIERERSGRG